MKKLFIILLVILFINSYKVDCQTIFSVDKWIEYVEELASETNNEERIKTLYSELSYLSENPFDLNKVTEEQLKKLPFLSDVQISDIIAYRRRYGNMLTIYELKNVNNLDNKTISLLLPFVYIGDNFVEKRSFTVKNMLKYGLNELQIRYDKCLQKKKGYYNQPDSVLKQYPNRKYLGESFYHSFRYSYSFNDKLQFGFVAEKDVGEPFWNKYHKGYDYCSLHFCLKDLGLLKTLSIGDYKISFGQGLIISSDFSLGKSTMVTLAERRNNGFRRHFSTNENDFFRGVASTINFKNIDISLFYSYRKMDANVSDNYIRSFKTDGLHQLIRERDKMNVVSASTIGANIRYVSPNVCIGFTSVSYSFGDKVVKPDSKPYNFFYFRGNKNINLGVDYMLKNNHIKFYGETAISKNKAVATLNAFQFMPVSYFSFLLLYRYYDKKYQAFYGNSFSQSSSVQNEEGIYMGMQFIPFSHWRLSGYIDVFRFPWLKYGVDMPSSGKEYMLQLDYFPDKNFTIYIRYKYKQREENRKLENESTLSILPFSQHRIRLQMGYNYNSCWLFRTSAEGIIYNEEKGDMSKGCMFTQSVGWKPLSFPLQADLYIGYFYTDDYNSRISSYEKNILYAFNMPSFYGKGIRTAFSVRWKLSKKLSFSTKLAWTHYMDRNSIGTGMEEIAGNNKIDIYALLCWKF